MAGVLKLKLGWRREVAAAAWERPADAARHFTKRSLPPGAAYDGILTERRAGGGKSRGAMAEEVEKREKAAVAEQSRVAPEGTRGRANGHVRLRKGPAAMREPTEVCCRVAQ